MVRAAASLLSSCALAHDEVAFADEALSLLQRSTKHVIALQASDEKDAVVDDGLDELTLSASTESLCPDCGSWPIKAKPRFGPDGTWEHPYCKDIQGCVPYCPAGCDGVAKWGWWTFPNSKFGVGGAAKGIRPTNQANFQYCEQGVRKGGQVGVLAAGGYMNCLGSENASKPSFWSQNGAVEKAPFPNYATNGQVYPKFAVPRYNAGYISKFSMTAYGHEYCPTSCVNDCAFFRYGNFEQCGSTGAYHGYNGGRAADGPNKNCLLGTVQGRMFDSYHWCGTTTTTTTTSTTTQPIDDGMGDPTPEDDTPLEITSPSDDAQAVGDPHIRTIKNGHSEVH